MSHKETRLFRKYVVEKRKVLLSIITKCSLNSSEEKKNRSCGKARCAIRMRICFITLLTGLSAMSYRVLSTNYSNFGNGRVSSKSPCILA